MSMTTSTTTSPESRSIIWCQSIAWLLSLTVAIVALVAWGRDYNWHFLPLNSYQLFPLFGLLAYSLMWSHYMA
ncbi:MAG: hypothetical protein WA843_00200, partial [Candidatus Saccharimonadales bacterium]